MGWKNKITSNNQEGMIACVDNNENITSVTLEVNDMDYSEINLL